MNRPCKTICAAASGLLLAICLSAPATAAAAVQYKGGADQFVETDGTDLFDNFKEVLPGDTLTQVIRLKNLEGSGHVIALYLRAESPDAAGRQFLSRLGLTVRQGDTILSQAPAADTGNLSSDVPLGRFAAGQSGDLTVTLRVPAGLDNEFASAAGAVNWVFTAQEYPAPTASPKPAATPGTTGGTAGRKPAGHSPQTGDGGVSPWALGAGCMTGLGGLLAVRRRAGKGGR